MFCEHCGTKKEEDGQFCHNCGKSTSDNTQIGTLISKTNIIKTEAIIKCGNCDYIGPGESARTTGAKILAWVCVVFAPLITIIYFVATSKYRCPKCKSTFVGVKNKEGVFTGQRGGAKSPAMIIVWVFLGIMIVAILSTVVMAGLNSAREKTRQSQEQGVENLNR